MNNPERGSRSSGSRKISAEQIYAAKQSHPTASPAANKAKPSSAASGTAVPPSSKRRQDAGASIPTGGKSDLKNNLRSQTPLNRKLKQKNAPSEPGTVRRTTKPQYYKIKEERRKERSVWGKRVLLVLICYAVLLPISLLLFSMWLPKHTTPETQDYTYQIGPDDDIISKKIYTWDVVRSGNIYYLEMSSLAELCEMTTTGDAERMRYIVRESGETVEFIIGQSLAYVNGIEERMEAVSYLKNGKVYIPMDFVNRCFWGVEATLDTENNKITVIRETDEDGNYRTVSFPFKQSEGCDPIEFASLDQEILDEIIRREEASKPQPEPEEPVSDLQP